MAAFLRRKGQILLYVTVDTAYVQPMNFLAPGSRDMFDANNKAVDYLFCALCQLEFDPGSGTDVCELPERVRELHSPPR
jgi:hypothetical protein